MGIPQLSWHAHPSPKEEEPQLEWRERLRWTSTIFFNMDGDAQELALPLGKQDAAIKDSVDNYGVFKTFVEDEATMPNMIDLCWQSGAVAHLDTDVWQDLVKLPGVHCCGEATQWCARRFAGRLRELGDVRPRGPHVLCRSCGSGGASQACD